MTSIMNWKDARHLFNSEDARKLAAEVLCDLSDDNLMQCRWVTFSRDGVFQAMGAYNAMPNGADTITVRIPY